MFDTIQQEAKSDSQLARLLDEARDYAQVYVLARQRQKGCDGMGELATMKEECRDVIDKVIQYSQEKKYISQPVSYDIDSIADEISRGRYPL
jgi:septum formation topological specificity factor MinE